LDSLWKNISTLQYFIWSLSLSFGAFQERYC